MVSKGYIWDKQMVYVTNFYMNMRAMINSSTCPVPSKKLKDDLYKLLFFQLVRQVRLRQFMFFCATLRGLQGLL